MGKKIALVLLVALLSYSRELGSFTTICIALGSARLPSRSDIPKRSPIPAVLESRCLRARHLPLVRIQARNLLPARCPSSHLVPVNPWNSPPTFPSSTAPSPI